MPHKIQMKYEKIQSSPNIVHATYITFSYNMTFLFYLHFFPGGNVTVVVVGPSKTWEDIILYEKLKKIHIKDTKNIIHCVCSCVVTAT